MAQSKPIAKMMMETRAAMTAMRQLAATPDPITHVAVHKMTVHDGHRLTDALDDLSRRSLALAVKLGDLHCGSSDNLESDSPPIAHA